MYLFMISMKQLESFRLLNEFFIQFCSWTNSLNLLFYCTECRIPDTESVCCFLLSSFVFLRCSSSEDSESQDDSDDDDPELDDDPDEDPELDEDSQLEELES